MKYIYTNKTVDKTDLKEVFLATPKRDHLVELAKACGHKAAWYVKNDGDFAEVQHQMLVDEELKALVVGREIRMHVMPEKHKEIEEDLEDLALEQVERQQVKKATKKVAKKAPRKDTARPAPGFEALGDPEE